MPQATLLNVRSYDERPANRADVNATFLARRQVIALSAAPVIHSMHHLAKQK